MLYSSTKFYFTLIVLSYIFTGNNTPQASIQSFFREWLNTAQTEGLLIFKRLIFINRYFFNIPTNAKQQFYTVPKIQAKGDA